MLRIRFSADAGADTTIREFAAVDPLSLAVDRELMIYQRAYLSTTMMPPGSKENGTKSVQFPFVCSML